MLKILHTAFKPLRSARNTYQVVNNLSPGSVVSIIGGGLSGVELASELNESRQDLKIRVFDRGDRILSAFPERLSTYVENWFDNHGVEMIINSNITRVEESVLYNHEEPVSSDIIVWTAGIQPNRLVRELDVEKDKQGRVIVNSSS